MATKSPRTIQVPGEPATAEAQAPIVGDAEQGQPQGDGADMVSDEVTQLRAQLEAERLARIEAEQRAAQAQAQAAGAARVVDEPKEAAPVSPVVAGQTAKLHAGGWVVPPTYGSPMKAA